jgi:hypothetical protein
MLVLKPLPAVLGACDILAGHKPVRQKNFSTTVKSGGYFAHCGFNAAAPPVDMRVSQWAQASWG